MPTILLSLLSSTLFRTFQSLCILISSCAHLALTQPTGIIFSGLRTCSAISCTVALFNSTINMLGLCSCFYLKPSERQQLNKIRPYMGSIHNCQCVYSQMYSSSNWSRSKVHVNSDVSMHCFFGPPFLLIKSISSSRCPTVVYSRWSCFQDSMISLAFDTNRITTMHIVYDNSRQLPQAWMAVSPPKSVASHLLPCHSFILASRNALKHCFRNITTHSCRIHSA